MERKEEGGERQRESESERKRARERKYVRQKRTIKSEWARKNLHVSMRMSRVTDLH